MNEVNRHINMYDYIIVGAGLSGCYMTYRLSQISSCKILVVEREHRIGGRILSDSDGLDYGAMRYFKSMERMNSLVEELGLQSDEYTVTSDGTVYYMRGKRYMRATLYPQIYDDYDVVERDGTVEEQLAQYLSERERRSVMSASLHFSPQFMQLYWDISGYNVMTSQQASDVWLIDNTLFTSETQLVLRDGFIQLCEQCLSRSGADVLLGTDAVMVDSNTVIINENEMSAHHVVFTGQLHDIVSINVEQQRLVRDISSHMQSIGACKIFIRFKSKWWKRHNIAECRHITDLPLSQFWIGWSDTICIVYASALNAVVWHDLIREESGVVRAKHVPQLTHELKRQIRLMFNIDDPLHMDEIRFKFWKSSYMYWKSSAHVSEYQTMLEDMQMVNSDYSVYQGWMEGALERVDNYLTHITS